LVKNSKTLKQIKDFYELRNLSLTEDRAKMAYLPVNAIAFDNNVGSAPGYYFKYLVLDIHTNTKNKNLIVALFL